MSRFNVTITGSSYYQSDSENDACRTALSLSAQRSPRLVTVWDQVEDTLVKRFRNGWSVQLQSVDN